MEKLEFLEYLIQQGCLGHPLNFFENDEIISKKIKKEDLKKLLCYLIDKDVIYISQCAYDKNKAKEIINDDKIWEKKYTNHILSQKRGLDYANKKEYVQEFLNGEFPEFEIENSFLK